MTWDFHVTGDNDGGAQELFANELKEVSGPGGTELHEALRNAAFYLGFAFAHTHQVCITTRGYLLANGVGSVTVSIQVVPDFPKQGDSDGNAKEVAP